MQDDTHRREATASFFLVEALRLSESQRPEGRNTSGLMLAGGAALFLHDQEIFRRFETVWDETPKADYGRGQSLQSMTDRHVKDCREMNRAQLIEYLREMAPERVLPCLEGPHAVARALAQARTALDIEEIGCTLAALGNYDLAREVAGHKQLEDFRTRSILWVIEAERLRDGVPLEAIDLSVLGLTEQGIGPWYASYIALCVLQRLPYNGYPYPDW